MGSDRSDSLSAEPTNSVAVAFYTGARPTVAHRQVWQWQLGACVACVLVRYHDPPQDALLEGLGCSFFCLRPVRR